MSSPAHTYVSEQLELSKCKLPLDMVQAEALGALEIPPSPACFIGSFEHKGHPAKEEEWGGSCKSSKGMGFDNPNPYRFIQAKTFNANLSYMCPMVPQSPVGDSCTARHCESPGKEGKEGALEGFKGTPASSSSSSLLATRKGLLWLREGTMRAAREQTAPPKREELQPFSHKKRKSRNFSNSYATLYSTVGSKIVL